MALVGGKIQIRTIYHLRINYDKKTKKHECVIEQYEK